MNGVWIEVPGGAVVNLSYAASLEVVADVDMGDNLWKCLVIMGHGLWYVAMVGTREECDAEQVRLRQMVDPPNDS